LIWVGAERQQPWFDYDAKIGLGWVNGYLLSYSFHIFAVEGFGLVILGVVDNKYLYCFSVRGEHCRKPALAHTFSALSVIVV
jgi:hypothetical protein